MRETAIVEQIRKLAVTGAQNKQIIRGIGDDCAIVRPSSGRDLVFTSDFVLEGRHFTLDTHSAVDVGHKALARSLSDLAAMGSKPVFCLVSLAVPAKLGSRWVDGFYRGLLGLATKYKVTLAGGDLARFDQVIADVMCCGEVAKGKALLRSTARPGDCIYVTGELGGSASGYRAGKGKNWKRHLRPEPRVNAGLALSRLGISSCMDLSDGLALDLHRLCLESRVGAKLDGNLPVARGASVNDALHGGEDYELVFTAPRKKKVPRRIHDLPVTAIGQITADNRGEMLFGDAVLDPEGFDHFA